jgi:hypothetical protein
MDTLYKYQQDKIEKQEVTIKTQKEIIEDLQQVIAILEDKLNLAYLENTILRSEIEYDVHTEQVKMEL